MCLLEGVMAHDDYLKLNKDASGKIDSLFLQKCIVPIWMLASPVGRELVDEHLCMGESTCLEAMLRTHLGSSDACIGNGRNVHSLGRGSLKDMLESSQSFCDIPRTVDLTLFLWHGRIPQ
jgi:hypothetical protein